MYVIASRWYLSCKILLPICCLECTVLLGPCSSSCNARRKAPAGTREFQEVGAPRCSIQLERQLAMRLLLKGCVQSRLQAVNFDCLPYTSTVASKYKCGFRWRKALWRWKCIFRWWRVIVHAKWLQSRTTRVSREGISCVFSTQMPLFPAQTKACTNRENPTLPCDLALRWENAAKATYASSGAQRGAFFPSGRRRKPRRIGWRVGEIWPARTIKQWKCCNLISFSKPEL